MSIFKYKNSKFGKTFLTIFFKEQKTFHMPKLHCKKSNFEGARAFPVFAKSAPFWIKFRLIWGLYLGRKGNF